MGNLFYYKKILGTLKKYFIYLFGCTGSLAVARWIFVAACGLFVAACRLLSSCGAWAPEFKGSVVAHRLPSCGTRALESAGFLPCGMWDISSLTRLEPCPLH